MLQFWLVVQLSTVTACAGQSHINNIFICTPKRCEAGALPYSPRQLSTCEGTEESIKNNQRATLSCASEMEHYGCCDMLSIDKTNSAQAGLHLF